MKKNICLLLILALLFSPIITYAEALPFKDVKTSDWYYESVKFAYENKIIMGYTSTKFAPSEKVTRGQLVTILWRYEGTPSASSIKNKFNDVSNNDYFTDAVKWAESKGIIHGYNDKKFGPNDPITRQDLAVILNNYAKYEGFNATDGENISNYADYSLVKGSYAEPALKWAIKNNVMSGQKINWKKYIVPLDNATRAETAAMITNFIKAFGSKSLYDVLQKEGATGVYAKEYTGNHQDSMDASKSTKKIYHWYAENDTRATEILDKNNVIFAGQCWQMIRTTDTGGVKMIYNGEVVDNQCLNTRESHVGYYSTESRNLSSNYWYGTDYIYDSTTKKFRLSGETEEATWNETTGPSLIGKYTCQSTSSDATCSTLYLIESYDSADKAYVISLYSNSSYSRFGGLKFNKNSDSLSDVGYMYNTRYPVESISGVEEILDYNSLSTNYWYAHDIVWGNPIENKYNLVDAYQVSATTDYPNLIGEYTFPSSTQTYTNASVRYIAAVNNTNFYYIILGNEEESTHDLSYYNHTYTYGYNYIDNHDGTYTINKPKTIERKDWYKNYKKIGVGKYVCKNAVDGTCSDLWYTTGTSTTNMYYVKVSNEYKFSNGFTWDGSKYILNNDNSITSFNILDQENLNNTHYTCWNENGECSTISYVYSITTSNTYYINLTGGKSIEDAINEMLYNDNVNTTNSTMKSGVDAWYKHTLLDYDEYIEDTIFCNERGIQEKSGWDPNGSYGTLYFKGYSTTNDLSCTNITDQFSTLNNKAKLAYKVGLMTRAEMNILNNNNVRKKDSYYWLGTPYSHTESYLRLYEVYSSGSIGYERINYSEGVRPAISLKSGIEYSSGDGSMANPYKIKLEN